MIYTFDGVPGWAISGSSTQTCATLYNGALSCPHPPDKISDWTNFVTALVRRYCPSGVPGIQYYELWNEPYDVFGTNNIQLSPAQLATLTHPAYGIIRSLCPAAKILTPSMSTLPGQSYSTPSYTSVADTHKHTSARSGLSVPTRPTLPRFTSLLTTSRWTPRKT